MFEGQGFEWLPRYLADYVVNWASNPGHTLGDFPACVIECVIS